MFLINYSTWPSLIHLQASDPRFVHHFATLLSTAGPKRIHSHVVCNSHPRMKYVIRCRPPAGCLVCAVGVIPRTYEVGLPYLALNRLEGVFFGLSWLKGLAG